MVCIEYKLVQKLVSKKWTTVHVLNMSDDHEPYLDLCDHIGRVLAIRIVDNKNQIIEQNTQAKMYTEATQLLEKRTQKKEKKKYVRSYGHAVGDVWLGKRQNSEKISIVAKTEHGWTITHKVGNNEIQCTWSDIDINNWIKTSKAKKNG